MWEEALWKRKNERKGKVRRLDWVKEDRRNWLVVSGKSWLANRDGQSIHLWLVTAQCRQAWDQMQIRLDGFKSSQVWTSYIMGAVHIVVCILCA